jgi:hypothetical protein
MTTPTERARENLTGILVFVILGAGFVALFAGVSWFWMIWVLGFAVLLPIVGILTGEADEDAVDPGRTAREPVGPARDRVRDAPDVGPGHDRDGRDPGTDVEDALDTLRSRYARGDLSDEQFERKLEALLDTETPEAARERVGRRATEREGATAGDADADRELDYERGRGRD